MSETEKFFKKIFIKKKKKKPLKKLNKQKRRYDSLPTVNIQILYFSANIALNSICLRIWRLLTGLFEIDNISSSDVILTLRIQTCLPTYSFYIG